MSYTNTLKVTVSILAVAFGFTLCLLIFKTSECKSHKTSLDQLESVLPLVIEAKEHGLIYYYPVLDKHLWSVPPERLRQLAGIDAPMASEINDAGGVLKSQSSVGSH